MTTIHRKFGPARKLPRLPRMDKRLVLFLVGLIGCWSEPESGPPCLRGAGQCRSRDDVTRAVGFDSARSIDATAKDVWPELSLQPALPAAADHARACVMLQGCGVLPLADCTNAIGSEENGVPYKDTNERVLFLVLAALEPTANCPALRTLVTPRPKAIVCESHGCEWISSTDPVPEVTCVGSVATLKARSGTFTRDCSHAFAECDPRSPTGCTDRDLLKCPSTAIDKCDGDVQLGCRQIGFVSLRNCKLFGGRCTPTGSAGNATCTYDKTCPFVANTCSGDALKVCTRGETFDVDCKALGFRGCAAGTCN